MLKRVAENDEVAFDSPSKSSRVVEREGTEALVVVRNCQPVEGGVELTDSNAEGKISR